MRAPHLCLSLRQICILTLLSPLAWLTTPRLAGETLTWTAGSGTQFQWADVANWNLGVPTLADDVVFGAPVPNPGLLPSPWTISLAEGSEAGSLWVRDSYTLTGGSLRLGTGGLRVDRAQMLRLDSLLQGSDGLSLTGGGAVRLTSSANSYTGITSISNGMLVISHAGALGASTGAVLVNGSATRGFGGGTLVLDAVDGTLTFGRDLVLQGYGPITDRGAALIGVGSTVLTGTVQYGAGNVATGLNSVAGMQTLQGSLFAQGTGTLRFGTVNSVGVGGYLLNGWLYGSTGSIEKIGGGTLILDPVNAAAFTGTVLVNGGSVRVGHGSALGGSLANGAVTLGAGVGTLEVRTDAPHSFATRRVLMGTSGNATLVLDHAIGSQLLNQNVTFGPLTLQAGGTTRTLTINGRNGYGATFAGDSIGGALGGNNTITVNASGPITIGGNFWNNTSTTARTLTMTVNTGARFVVEGSLIASGAAHLLVKSGAGTLAILGDESTYTGSTTISAGTLAISHFGSINNNNEVINIGATTAAGVTLDIIGHNLTAQQATTSKVINLAGTTGGATLFANQTGSSAGLRLEANLTATGAGAKALTLGGANMADNTVAGVIPNHNISNLTSLVKTGAGTWVLSGANTYTGATLINNGVLKIQDIHTGSSRNVLADNALVGLGFSLAPLTAGTAGGVFEYLGAAGEASSESLGTLLPGGGAGTVRVTPGAGGTATLRFASVDVAPSTTLASAVGTTATTTLTVASTAGLVPGMRVTGAVGAATYIVSITNGTQIVVNANQTNLAAGTTLTFDRANGGATINFDPAVGGNVVIGTVPSVGLLNSYSYFNGADFAYAPSTTDALLRAPVYGADPGFVTAGAALSANNHNLVTGNTSTGAATLLSLKIEGSSNPVVNQTGLLTVRTGAAGTSGGILVTGGTATLQGTGVSTGGAGELIIRVNGASDVLHLNAPVTATTTGGLTKTGAGTLVIGGLNAYTTGGSTQLLEGTIQLAPGGRLSANSVNFFMRQNTVFDLNGVSTAQSATTSSIGAFNGTGTIANSSAAPVVFAVGGGTTGGSGTFNGSILETLGRISVVKMGTTNSQTWNGLSNYTGSTTIGVPGTGTTGSLSVFYIADIGQDSSIGRGDGADLAANQGSLIFGGTTGGLIYIGEASVSTNRLFTLAGTGVGAGATITNNGVNNAALIFSNPNPIAFSSTANQLLRLGGSSVADNWFLPQIGDNMSAGAVTSLTKLGAGLWILGNSANSYTGETSLLEGTLQAVDGASLPTASGLVLGGAGATTTTSIFQSSGVFVRSLGTGPNTVSWGAGLTTGGGGFAAAADKLVVAIGGLDSPTPLVWNTAGFIPAGTGAGASLVLNSPTALGEVEFRNAIDLNGANRVILVNDNTATFTDYATIRGAISNSSGTAGITKSGNGTLQLLGANTYNGVTAVTAGSLIVNSLGNSVAGGASSVGTASASASAALTLGNAGTTAGILQYVGQGEVSDRMIRLNTTTGSTQIHADGTGPLVLTNVLNDMALGAKTLFLRGSNAMGNAITSDLTNNGGNLAITIDGGASWILSGNNTYSGSTTVSAGALGIGSSTALGNGTLVLSSGSVFAHGGDRTLENAVTYTANTGTAFLGENSLTLGGAVTLTGTTTSLAYTTTNSISADKVLTLEGALTSAATAARTWTINGSGNTVFNGDIFTTGASTVAVNYTGNGSLTLGGTNTTGGSTTINNAAGRVFITHDNVFGTGNAILTTGTLLSAGGDRTLANNVTHGGTFILDGADKFTFNGIWLNNAGSRTLTVNTTGGIELAGEVRLSEHATTARTLTLNGTGDVLISGVVSNGTGTGASSLTYTGTGTLTLSGANTFTGNTTLNNNTGTLLLSGLGKLGSNNLTVNAGSLRIEGGVNQQVQLLTLGGGAAGSSATVEIAAGRSLAVSAVTFSATNNNLTATVRGAGTLDLGTAGITLTINSSSQAEVDLALEVGAITGSGTFIKAGAGTLDLRGVGSFNYAADAYQLDGGAVLGLAATDANLMLNGGVFQGSGSFDRALGSGVNQVQWQSGGGGFAAFGGPFSVSLTGAPDPLVWGGTAFFVPDGAPLIFGSTSADNVVTFTPSIQLNGAARTVSVIDNPFSENDKAVLAGNLTNGSLTKIGNGILELSGSNSFSGTLTVNAGRLQFSSLANAGGNAALALSLGGGSLEYLGAGTTTLTGAVAVATATSSLLNAGSGLLDLQGFVTLTTTLNVGGSGPLALSGTTLNSGGTRTINVIGSGGVTFGDIQLSESATTARTLNLNVAAGSTATVTGVVSNGVGTGASVLTKQGEGHLILNGANTNSGNLIIQNGLVTMTATNTGAGLQLGGGPTGSSSELILDGADFNLNTTVFYLNANNPLTGQVNGSGSIRLNATRTFEIRPSLNASQADSPTPDLVINVPVVDGAAAAGITKSRNGVLVLAANNAYTGTTTVNEGVLRLDYSTQTGSKIAASAPLILGGGTLELIGHATTPVSQSAGAFTVGAGFNRLQVDATAGAGVTLNLNGALTSTAVGRSIDFTLLGAGAAVNVTGTGWTTLNGLLGGWATYNSSAFASLDLGGNVVAAESTARDNVATWLQDENLRNTAGFTGTVAHDTRINSLIFEAAAPSMLNLAGLLDIASGGILVAPSVGANAAGIQGGQLVTAGNQLFVHQHNTGAAFLITSTLGGSGSLTKNGRGELVLDSASNSYSGVTRVNQGVLTLRGGNAVGDTSAVILDPVIGAWLRLEASERIGTLAGGGLDGGNVDLGSHTLTLNNYAATTFSGLITGSGTLVKEGAGSLTLNTIASPDFTGHLVINQGQVTLGNRQIANFSNLGSLTLNSGTLLLDFTGGTEAPNKINNSAPVTLINTGGIDGLRANNDRNDASKAETVGAMTLLGGANTITASASSTSGATQRNMTITTASLTRLNQSTLLVRGQNLGTTLTGAPLSPIHTGRVVVTSAPALTGGGGAAGTATVSILPWAVGSESLTGQGDTFVTHAATTGFRPLNLETEYEQLTRAGGIDALANVRLFTGGTVRTSGAEKTMNALLLQAATSVPLTLDGDGAALQVQSGGFLFTGDQGILLQGFRGITTGNAGQPAEYIFHVVNSSASGVTLDSPLTSSGAVFTKSGNGLLILKATGSTYSGLTAVNQGVLQIDSLDKLGDNGSGGLQLNAGTLRFGAVFDPSQTRITLGVGATGFVQTTVGGTFDTNGFDITLANSIGNGGNGGFTKAGLGTLTFNAPVNYRGITTVANGTLALGVANALPAGANLAFGGGTLDLGGHAASYGDVTLTGNGSFVSTSVLTLTGTVVNFGGNRTLNFNGGGTTTVSGVIQLAESTTARTLTLAVNDGGTLLLNGTVNTGPATTGILVKAGDGTLEMSGRNSYTTLTINNGLLRLKGTTGNQPVTVALNMGGGPAGASSTIELEAGAMLSPATIAYSATNNNLASVIRGAGTLNLGDTGITVTVNNSTLADVDMAWEVGRVIGSGLFIKAGAGTLDIRGVANYDYNASGYRIDGGAILGLDTTANLVLNGGVFEGAGTFTRALGTGDQQVQWAAGTAGGGFSAATGGLVVTLSGVTNPLVWGGTPLFVASGAPLIFGSSTADGVVEFTHDINLNGAARTISVIDNPLSGLDRALLSGTLSNGSLTKTGNGILQLGSSANSFTAVTLNGGTLEFAALGNLGGGAVPVALEAGFLSFAGSSNLTVTNPISGTTGTASQTAGVRNLAANGVGGAVVTFSSAISMGLNTLTLAGSGDGVISGGISQTGNTTADLVVASGNWTLRDMDVTVSDDLLVNGGTLTLQDMTLTLVDDVIATGVGTILNLNSTGVLAVTTPGGTSGNLYSRNGAVINVNAADVYGVGNSGGLDFILAGDSGAGATGTINLNGNSLTGIALQVGGIADGLEGAINGPGTIHLTSTTTDWGQGFRLFRGLVSANLSGVSSLLKQGVGTVVLSGDNSGLSGTVATTRVDAGTLILDYTTHNTAKISTAVALDLRGGTVRLEGNAGAGTSQTVNGLLLNAGSSALELVHGGGQSLNLNVGNITRNTNGVLHLSLSANASVQTSVPDTDYLGGWAAVNNRFAAVSGGLITAAATATKDNLGTWAAGDNLVDANGYQGTVGSLVIANLVFESANASTVTLEDGAVLTLGNGGLLVAPGAGPAAITGGVLASGFTTGTANILNLVLHQQNTTADFTLSATLDRRTTFTKAGPGTLVLDGFNDISSRAFHIGDGTVRATGGNALGDFSPVTLSVSPGVNAILDLSDVTERVGGLLGGAASSTGFGSVLLGSTGTVIVDQRAAGTFSAVLSGGPDTTVIKNSGGTWSTNSTRTEFTGQVIINGGGIRLDGNTSGADVFSLARAFAINGPGSHLISDQDQTSSMNLIGNTAALRLSNTAPQVTAAVAYGLIVVNTIDAGLSETVGQVTLQAGHNGIFANISNGSNASRIATLTMAGLNRENHATALLGAQNLGAAGPSGRIVVTGATVASLGGIGGAVTAGTPTIGIIPYLIGQAAGTGTTEANLYSVTGNSFVTYAGATGFRALELDSEYTLNADGYNALSGVTNHNVRFAITPGALLAGGSKTINSLVLDASGESLEIVGDDSDVLTLASGALLATTTQPANSIALGGFSELRTGTGEYLIYVTHAAQSLSISSPLTSSASLTKAGAGTLVLQEASSYNGGTWFNQGLIEVFDLSALGSGDLHFFGGGLRWAPGATFDPSASGRQFTFNDGGALFDTNGNDITLAGPVGNGGVGGLTKLGNGRLTLLNNTVVNFSGGITVAGGTTASSALVLGAAGVLPAGTDLTLGINGALGGYLDHGAFETTLRGLNLHANSVIGGSADLTFTGNVEVHGSAARTLTVSNGGLTTFSGDFFVLVDRGGTARTLTLAGTGSTIIHSEITDGAFAGALTLTNTGITTLTGFNSYSGVTAVNAGVLRIRHDDALGNTAGGTTIAGDTSSAVLELSGGITVRGETLTLGARQNAGINNTHLRNADGANEWAGNINFTTGGSTYSIESAEGVLTLSGVISGAATTGTRNLRLVGAADGVVSGTLINGSAVVNLTKDGAGVWNLTSANTYTGGTMVSGGTLLTGNTGGSATGTGAVTVAPGAILGGNGIIAPAANNNVTVNGTLQVGAVGDTTAQQLTLATTGSGLVTVNGVVAFDLFGGQGSGTLNAQSGNNDQLVVSGTSGFTIGGSASLQVTTSLPITEGTWAVGTEWKLFDWSGLSGGVNGTFSNLSNPAPFNYVNLPDLGSIGLAWDVSNLYTAGTIMVVAPEPGRMLLVFLGLMGLFFRRRR